MKNFEKVNALDYKAEKWIFAFLLAISGGLQDAYSFFLRDHVFANAQTGNVVLLSRDIFSHNCSDAIRYIIPLLAFLLGIFVVEIIRLIANKKYVFANWRKIVLFIEATLLFAVGFLPTTYNYLANAFISFTCAMQVQSFRRVDGQYYASTMCIGNLRSFMEALFCAYANRSREKLKYALGLLTIIILFAIGAGVGYSLSPITNLYTIWISSFILFFSAMIL